MGDKNSSLTRVAPVFNELKHRFPDAEYLKQLLMLPRFGSGEILDLLDISSSVNKDAWQNKAEGGGEEKLSPPGSLLKWLVENFNALSEGKNFDSSETGELRRKLSSGDNEALQDALQLLKENHPDRAWYVFEGPTYPDVYLETDKAIVVIEGKRTEAGLTKNTTWMPVRHQMLRHMDCVLDRLNGRRLFGFFIVEGDDGGRVRDDWQIFSLETISVSVRATASIG